MPDMPLLSPTAAESDQPDRLGAMGSAPGSHASHTCSVPCPSMIGPVEKVPALSLPCRRAFVPLSSSDGSSSTSPAVSWA